MPLPLASRIQRVEDGDHIFMPSDELIAKMYWPVRTCGDIPFYIFHADATTSPSNYLHFLKELETSDSRHDFLFWVFDIIAAGRNRKENEITSDVLDSAACHYMHDIKSTVRSAMRNSDGLLSEYIIRKYPHLFAKDYFQCMKQKKIFKLTTFHSNNEELWNYRKMHLEKLVHHKYRQCNYNPVYYVNPMEHLALAEFPEEQIKAKNIPPLKYSLGEDEYPGYIENLKYEHEDHDLSPALHYFKEVLIYTGMIPERNECILINKNPYRQMQAKAIMKHIVPKKFVPVNPRKLKELDKNQKIVVARVKDSAGLEAYKRVHILFDSERTDDKVQVFNVDTGECPIIPVNDIFEYNFKGFPQLRQLREQQNLSTTDEVEHVTVAERVHRRKLPANDLQINDFFSYDSGIFTTGIPSYIPYGRSKKPVNFFREDEPVRHESIKILKDEF